MKTSDGFVIDQDDKVEEVIEDGQVLNTVSYEEWEAEKAKECKKEWASISQEDFESGKNVSMAVGATESGKEVFVRFCVGESKRLEIIQPKDISNFSKDGKVLLASKSTREGVCEAHYIVENGEARYVEISAKSSTDERAKVKRVELVREEGLFKQGEVSLVQDSADGGQEEEGLKRVEEEGPKIDEESLCNRDVPKKVEYTAGPGESGLQLSQTEPTSPDQAYGREGNMFQTFTLKLQCINTLEKQLNIVKLKSHYLDKNGNKVEFDSTFAGRNGSNNIFIFIKVIPF